MQDGQTDSGPMVLNPFTFPVMTARLGLPDYALQSGLQGVLTDAFRVLRATKEEEIDNYFESKLPDLLLEGAPLSRGWTAVSPTFLSRFLFCQTLDSVFEIDIKSATALEFFQFVQLLSNDFNPHVFKKLLLVWEFWEDPEPPTAALLREFGDPGVPRPLLAKRRLFREWKRNFRKFFFLLEVWEAVEAAFDGKSIVAIGEVLGKFGKTLSTKPWLLPTGHLLWKAGLALNGSPLPALTVFRPEMLADSSLVTEVTVLDLIGQVQFGVAESDLLLADYGRSAGRATQEAEARFTRLINEDIGE